MAVALVSQSPATLRERKTRRSHTKTRTGCLTCKIRHKKCDETRPACIRCTSTGRKCDGYDSTPTALVVHSDGPAKPGRFEKRIADDVASLGFAEPIESFSLTIEASVGEIPRAVPTALRAELKSDIHLQCFDYFRRVTGPQFGSYFDSTFWGKFISSTALSDPLILKAAAAVGAVHRRYNLGITPEAFRFCEIAARLKKDAIRSFLELSASTPSQAHRLAERSDVLMAVSVLFGLFEVFQDNCESAVQHITYGIQQLWNRPMTLTRSESQKRRTELTPELFHQLFFKLHARATELFGRPPHIITPFQMAELPPISDSFPSLSDALDSIFTQAEWILHAPAHLMLDPPSRQRARHTHVSRILAWSAAYAETISKLPSRTPTQREACHLLCLVRNTIYLVLYIVFFTQPDTQPLTSLFPPPTMLDQDSLSTNLTRLLLQADSVLNTSSPFAHPLDHTFSIGSGIGPPRLPVPGPASSSKTRHLVTSLLASSPSPSPPPPPSFLTRPNFSLDNPQSNPEPVVKAYPIAERLNSIEEHAVLAAAAQIISSSSQSPPKTSTSTSILPSVLDYNIAAEVQWIDLTCFLEEDRLLLRYCRPSIDGNGLIWTREWWKFSR